MTQDNNPDGPDHQGTGAEGSEDLPDFLRNEDLVDETEIIERVSEAGAPIEPQPTEEPPGEGETGAPAAAPKEATHMPAEAPEKTKRGKKAAFITLACVLGLGIAYVGAAWYFSDRVPAETEVAGVDISQLSKTDAISELTAGLEEVTSEDIVVKLGEAESDIDVEHVALAVDYDATVEQLVGFSLDPRVLIDHLFGNRSHDPVITYDSDALKQTLTAISEDFNIDPVEGELSLVDGEVEKVEPEDGVNLDIDAAGKRVIDQWLEGDRPVELPGVVVEPAMGEAELKAAQESVIDPLFSGDLELNVNDEKVSIPKEVITQTADLKLSGTTYEVIFDEEELSTKVTELLPGIGESPKNASFKFKDGKPTIVPSVAGAGLKPETLATEVASAALKTGEERTVTLELETTEPEFTTKDAEKLGVKERVSHFDTPVPYDPVRTKNLVTGAEKLNGMLIKPGETFSLIDALGPITTDNGYVASGVVVDGFEDTAMGGGLSQISTTAFNAAFEAGMEDVTHQPHSRYFTRYPEGREATMFTPDLDMKWRNNTPHGVVVQAWIDDDAHVALWSTEYWDTKITTGPRTNITSPKKVYNPSPECTPESGGSPGFTVSVQRVVSKDGQRNDEFSRSYTHTYQPWNNVICGEKPDS